LNKQTVAIIGAGPAGLAAAHELVKCGLSPIVLERADRIGGLARTETYKGYFFDVGGHRFFTKNNEISRLWQEMLCENLLRVPRISRIYYQGRFFNYPLSAFNALANLGLMRSVLILGSYLRSQARPYPEEETFEQWVSNRFGRRLYWTFFKTYTEKVWGIPCHKIRAEWAAQRIKGLSLMAAVSNALLGLSKAKSLINEFHYPLMGPGMMWEGFREKIEAAGGQVLTDSEAVTIDHKGGHVISLTYLERGNKTSIPVSHLISSMPITSLVEMLNPGLPDRVREAARHLSYRAFILVVLIVDRKDLFPDQWIYVHSPEVKVGRIQNFKNWSKATVPDSRKTSIGMEYFCSEGDDLWRLPDAELKDTACQELSRLGFAAREEVVDSCVIRQPMAYPVYDEDYGSHLALIRQSLANFSNLHTVGRNGMHRYNNMDHSMQTGILAAQNTLGAHHDLWAINEEETYLEEDSSSKRTLSEEALVRTFARMDKLAFASALGSVSGLLCFLATVWLILRGGDVIGPNLSLLGQYFVGYTVTLKGAVIAMGYGFFWGFMLGWLVAYLRNLLLALYVFRVRKKAELLSLRDFVESL